MPDENELKPVEPVPLDYGRPSGTTAGQQVGGAISLLTGLAVGAAFVLVAGAATAIAADGHVPFAIIGVGWFAVAVALGYAAFRLVRRTRAAAPLTRAIGRYFLLGLIIGGLLAALCDGTCFVGTDRVQL